MSHSCQFCGGHGLALPCEDKNCYGGLCRGVDVNGNPCWLERDTVRRNVTEGLENATPLARGLFPLVVMYVDVGIGRYNPVLAGTYEAIMAAVLDEAVAIHWRAAWDLLETEGWVLIPQEVPELEGDHLRVYVEIIHFDVIKAVELAINTIGPYWHYPDRDWFSLMCEEHQVNFNTNFAEGQAEVMLAAKNVWLHGCDSEDESLYRMVYDCLKETTTRY
jgi:hypothetical protein